MKKIVGIILFVLLLAAAAAMAQEAEDITAGASVKASSTDRRYKTFAMDCALDRDFNTMWKSAKERRANLEIKSPEPVYGIYLCNGTEKLEPWVVEIPEGKSWTVAARGEGIYGHEYLALDGLTHFRIRLEATGQKVFAITELYLLGEGEVPGWVQRWQPQPEKADLMILVGHPDDEMLFFGGMIPTYAGEYGMNVVVCYMTCNYPGRRSELLNGLWYCGVRTYPDIGTFWDKYSLKLNTQYDTWGKATVLSYVTGLIRRYKPEVIATHDVNGEYGHGAHRVCADACLQCVTQAADPNKYKPSVSEWGTWQPKKLYIHMYKKDQVEFNWDVPLASQDGKTGYETAVEAYKLYVSQQQPQYQVEPRGSEKSCYLFGLAYSAVGPDVLKNDPFENIDPATLTNWQGE
ncbi:MAG: PIG-L family deacetylase [Clostridia bacterium]|nr:PIG-L family deacetylase [Clostridia bacterium]